MATNATFEPYEYYEDQKVVGIDPDIAQAVCDVHGYDLKIEEMCIRDSSRIVFPNDNTGTNAGALYLLSLTAVAEHAEIVLYLLYRFICDGYDRRHNRFRNAGDVQTSGGCCAACADRCGSL